MGIHTEAVQKLYVAYFNRPADALGLIYWEEQIANNGGDASAVANAFSASQEYKDLYAGKTSAQIIDALYQNLFGRAAEVDGLLYWGSRLDNGTFNIGNIAMAILTGAQGDDQKVIENKTAAAAEFTKALDTNVEIVGYSGNAANAVAKTWLATIDETAESLTAAKGALTGTITEIVSKPAANGQTFNLTTAVDNTAFVGTANNDTYNATPVKADGTSATTLQGFDVLDGGDGVDTLNITVKSTPAAGDDAATAFNTVQTGTVKNIEIINIDNTEAADAIFGGDAVDASKFVGSTVINQIGKANDVNNIAASQTVVLTGADIGVELTAAASATTMNVKLKDAVSELSYDGFTSETDSTLTISGAKLNVVNIAGGAKISKAGTTVEEGVFFSDVATLKEDSKSVVDVSVIAGANEKTLTINAESALDLDVEGDKLTKLDLQGVDAGVVLNSNNNAENLATILSGDGADSLYNLTTRSAKDVAATTADETINVTIDTGSDNDYVQVSAQGAGKTTINLDNGDDGLSLSVETSGEGTERAVGTVTATMGAGNDSVYLSNGLEAALTKLSSTGVVTTSDVKIDGGEGEDTLSVYDQSINDATYDRLALNVTNFEVIEFYEGAGNSTTALKADKLAQFDKLVFGETSFVSGVSADQTLVTDDSLTATATGFKLDSDTTKDGNQTTYAGTLNIVQEGEGTLIANADVVNLTVAAESYAYESNFVEADGYAEAYASSTYIDTGYFQSLNVTLQAERSSGLDNEGDEALSYVEVDVAMVDATDNEIADPVATASIHGTKTITVTGPGVAVINANAVALDADGKATLTTIDVSGMTAFANLDNNGDEVKADDSYGYQNLSTTTITGNNAAAETIKLGGALDTVITASTGAKMDTITGFELVAGTTTGTTIPVNFAKSDALVITGAAIATGNDFAKVKIDAGNSTLALALDQVAKGAVDQAVFVVGDNTYVYVDTGADKANTYDAANDIVVKLTGTYDLDLLAQAVIGTVNPLI